jgi:hypothetical protein
MLRLAICISLVDESENNNAGVNDFDREENRINNSDNSRLAMETKALLYDYQRLF